MEECEILDDLDWDAPIRLDVLVKVIKDLQKKYGVRSIVRLDAGYNNISLFVAPSKKGKK